MRTRHTYRHLLAVGLVALALSSVFSLVWGTSAVGAVEALEALVGRGDQTASLVVRTVRLPRVLAAVACGAGLSVAGLLLQSALDNSLASPGIIGINAGAGFGVLVAGLVAPGLLVVRQSLAFVGALTAAACALLVAAGAGATRSTLVLAGVAVSSLATALSNAIVTLSPQAVTDRVAFSLGGLSGASASSLGPTVAVVATGIACATALSGGMDLLALGDEAAHGLGLDVARQRILAVVVASVMASSCVCVCGLLGFVGLVVPNIVRMAGPLGCRRRLALCCEWGPVLLVCADLLARIVAFPYELPVGLVLSLVGAPFFIWVLVSRRGRHA